MLPAWAYYKQPPRTGKQSSDRINKINEVTFIKKANALAILYLNFTKQLSEQFINSIFFDLEKKILAFSRCLDKRARVKNLRRKKTDWSLERVITKLQRRSQSILGVVHMGSPWEQSMDFGSVFCSPLEKNSALETKTLVSSSFFSSCPVFSFKKWLAKMVGKSIVSLLNLVQ